MIAEAVTKATESHWTIVAVAFIAAVSAVVSAWITNRHRSETRSDHSSLTGKLDKLIEHNDAAHEKLMEHIVKHLEDHATGEFKCDE